MKSDSSLLKTKYEALKAENQKLKELLRQNESILGTRLAETKQDQQQLVTLCNLIYPILSGVLGVKQFQKAG